MDVGSSNSPSLDFSQSSANTTIAHHKNAQIPRTGPLRGDINLALICASNVNRSMEAHHRLLTSGFNAGNLFSYGTGTKIRLPGESLTTPNVYEFGEHSYEDIASDLKNKNVDRYTQNGILAMIQRDAKVKAKPQKFQSEKSVYFSIIVTFEKRVFEAVIFDIENRNNNYNAYNTGSTYSSSNSANTNENAYHSMLHVINLETPDNHVEALNSSILTEKLIAKIYEKKNWQDEITEVLDAFEIEHNRKLQHIAMFY